MSRQKKQEKMLTPKPYFITKVLSSDARDEKEIRQTAFESQVFETLQKTRGYTNVGLKKFPVNEHRFFSLDDLDADCTVRILHRSFDLRDMFHAPDKIRKLYDDEAVNIVVLNDFEYRSCLGIAMAALGVIPYEDMLGVLTTIPNADCSPIYVGRTADIFTSLVVAGLIPRWNPILKEDE